MRGFKRLDATEQVDGGEGVVQRQANLRLIIDSDNVAGAGVGDRPTVPRGHIAYSIRPKMAGNCLKAVNWITGAPSAAPRRLGPLARGTTAPVSFSTPRCVNCQAWGR